MHTPYHTITSLSLSFLYLRSCNKAHASLELGIATGLGEALLCLLPVDDVPDRVEVLCRAGSQ